jgi:hypothetical protein
LGTGHNVTLPTGVSVAGATIGISLLVQPLSAQQAFLTGGPPT